MLTVHASMTQVVMEAYTQGMSTRKIDDLAQALGMSGISKSTASRMLVDLEEGVRQFCQRPLPACPYVFVDARYEKVRIHHDIPSLPAQKNYRMQFAVGQFRT